MNNEKNILLIFTCCFIALFCGAMEKESDLLHGMQSLSIKKLTSIQNPNCVQYLDNHRIVLSCREGCYIINKNDDIAAKIDDFACFNVAVHQKKQKIVFSNNKGIKLYDMTTNRLQELNMENNIVFTTVKSPCLFDACGNIILHAYDQSRNSYVIQKYDCIKNNWSNVRDCSKLIKIAFHSEKQIMCTVHGYVVKIYDLVNVGVQQELAFDHGSYCCSLSDDGLFAVMSNLKDKISIIDIHKSNSNLNNCVFSLNTMQGEKFTRMLFYSGSVLATISQSLNAENYKYIMRYWNIKTLQPIYAVDLSKINTIFDITFSPNGEEVLFMFHNNCEIFSVPFIVRYISDNKAKFPHLLFLLKQYVEQWQEGPQKDIIKIIACMCLNI
jgi:tricorn protease-like protein